MTTNDNNNRNVHDNNNDNDNNENDFDDPWRRQRQRQSRRPSTGSDALQDPNVVPTSTSTSTSAVILPPSSAWFTPPPFRLLPPPPPFPPPFPMHHYYHHHHPPPPPPFPPPPPLPPHFMPFPPPLGGYPPPWIMDPRVPPPPTALAMPLPPPPPPPLVLQSQPLPDSQQEFKANNTGIEIPACTTCLEPCVEQPYTCGTTKACQARYCHTCVQRMVPQPSQSSQQSPSQSTQASPPTQAEHDSYYYTCPTCRNITREFIVDTERQLELAAKPGGPCPFAKCHAQLKTLTALAQHVTSCCPHEIVSCRMRLATGCPWQGPRHEAAQHHNTSCPYRHLTVFVQRLLARESDWHARVTQGWEQWEQQLGRTQAAVQQLQVAVQQLQLAVTTDTTSTTTTINTTINNNNTNNNTTTTTSNDAAEPALH